MLPSIFKITHGQQLLLPQIRCLITLRVENNIMKIDDNITDNIIRKVANVCCENYWTQNEALIKTPDNYRIFQNSSANHIFFIFFQIHDGN